MKTAGCAVAVMFVVLATGATGAQRPNPIDRILETDLRADLFTLAGDGMRGREGSYYRSDHLAYARHGVPALFFTTLLHPDYHTPFDNPDLIDVAKLTKMTRWMYETGRVVGEADRRPAVEAGFKLERCRDVTGTYC